MFSRDSRPPHIDTLIGKGVRVQGDIAFLGGMHLDGAIAGNVRSDQAPNSTLSVSETGSIEGSVEVPNVILQGHIRGDIRGAERVVLGARSWVSWCASCLRVPRKRPRPRLEKTMPGPKIKSPEGRRAAQSVKCAFDPRGLRF